MDNFIDQIDDELKVFICYLVVKCLEMGIIKEEFFEIGEFRKISKFVLLLYESGFDWENFLGESVNIMVNEGLNVWPMVKFLIEGLVTENIYELAKHFTCEKSMFLRFLDTTEFHKHVKVNFLKCIVKFWFLSLVFLQNLLSKFR